MIGSVIWFFWAAFAKPTIVPRGVQNVAELGVLFVRDQILRPMMGKKGDGDKSANGSGGMLPASGNCLRLNQSSNGVVISTIIRREVVAVQPLPQLALVGYT